MESGRDDGIDYGSGKSDGDGVGINDVGVGDHVKARVVLELQMMVVFLVVK